MKKQNIAILAVLILSTALPLGIFCVHAQYENLNETQKEALRNCRNQYVEALAAYNNKDGIKVVEFLQAAAKSIKDTDVNLADLMEQLINGFNSEAILSVPIARR